MKSLAMLVSLSLLLSSCYSYQRITKTEPITRNLLSTLQPGKDYKFELKSGAIQTIFVTAVDGDTIKGFLYQRVNGKMTQSDYLDTFENIEKSVSTIAVKNFQPGKTYITIGVGTALATALLIYAIGL